MSPQSSMTNLELQRQGNEATVEMRVMNRPVNWEELNAEHSPSPEVADAVRQVFLQDAEILRRLA